MARRWFHWLLSDAELLWRVSWRTREPRGRIYDDGKPSVATMLKALKSTGV